MSEAVKNNYYYGVEVKHDSFFCIPKALFTKDPYKKMSSNAKMLYGLMLDRLNLSIQNEWFDEDRKAYIYFTIEAINEFLGCTSGTALRILSELDSIDGVGLIERVKQGQGKPTKIYVKKIDVPANATPENATDEPEKEKCPETENPQKNDVDDLPKLGSEPEYDVPVDSVTDENDNQNSSEIESDNQTIDSNVPNVNADIKKNEYRIMHNVSVEAQSIIDKINNCRETIKRNIEYDLLIGQYGPWKMNIDEMVEIMVETVTGTKDFIKVNQENTPAILIREAFLKINYGHMTYVLRSLDSKATNIRNIRAYLLTTLYNSVNSIGNHHTAQIKHNHYSGNYAAVG